MRIVECVPNISEGRRPEIYHEVANAAGAAPGVTLLNVDPGADTNRTVITFLDEPDAVLEAAFRLVKKGVELIDMSAHRGAHPRIGAVDVVPFIPVAGVTMDDCVGLARRLGERVGRELHVPVYLYEYACSAPHRRNLADVREGEYEGCARKLVDPRWTPDFGPAEFVPRSGAIVIGARKFLVAYNVNLNTLDKRLATRVAFDVRERGRMKRDGDGNPIVDAKGEPVWEPGILKSVKAVGWVIPEFGCAQVSINLTDLDVTPLHVAFDTCDERARERGLRVTGSEIVGLVPRSVLLEAGGRRGQAGRSERARHRVSPRAGAAPRVDECARLHRRALQRRPRAGRRLRLRAGGVDGRRARGDGRGAVAHEEGIRIEARGARPHRRARAGAEGQVPRRRRRRHRRVRPPARIVPHPEGRSEPRRRHRR